MAIQKLSAGTLASSLAAADRFPLAQSGADRAATIGQVLDFVEAQTYPRMVPAALMFSPFQAASASGFAVVAGSYYGVLFRGRPGDTIERVAIEVTTAPTVGGNVRIGLYANDPATRLPVATAGLIYDSGSIAFTTGSFAVSTTPVLIALPAAQVFPDDGHLWAVIQSDTASSMQWRRGSALYGQNLLPRAVNAGALSTTNNDCGISATGTFGAMPANPPAMTAGSNIPMMALQRA
jgi:hypothetical protein